MLNSDISIETWAVDKVWFIKEDNFDFNIKKTIVLHAKKNYALIILILIYRENYFKL